MREAQWLTLLWTPGRQEFSVDGERFAHPMETPTSASHDVAHLLAAASGLSWKPSGTRDDVCFAELAAVLLEHLADNVSSAVLLGRGTAEGALSRTLEYARWFIDEHYKPFPVSFDRALAEFVSGLEIETAARLSPVLFRTRIFELEHQDARELVLEAAFSSHFVPEASSALSTLRTHFAKALVDLSESAAARAILVGPSALEERFTRGPQRA